MKGWVLAVSLLAGAVAPMAWAADDGPPPPKSGAYDDPRYFPKAPPRPKTAPPPSLNYEDDDDDRYDGQPPPAKKYSGAPPPYGQNCVRSEQVRERLTSFGWQDFHGGQPQGDLVTLRARRPSGRLFELTLHRCTGQIVDVRPLESRPYGPYAFKGPHNQEGYDGPPRRSPYSYDGPWYEGPYRGPRRWFRDY